MTPFAILVKSHAPDLAYARRLLDSIRRFNTDDVPVFVVVPGPDVTAFAAVAGGATVLPETAFTEHLVTEPVNGYAVGYLNQEIIKLAFWETDQAGAYLCIDSDAEIIRPFAASDFMVDAQTPYTFLTRDRMLQAEPRYAREHWAVRLAGLRRIQHEIGRPADEPILTVHGHAVFSSAALRSFRDDFLAPRGWGYRDALALAPYEPTWYSLWVQHARPIPLVRREPVFRTFHNADEHLDYLVAGLSVADIARGYVGVVVNSNFSRGAGVMSINDDRADLLAAYLPPRMLGAAAVRRLSSGWRPARGPHPPR